VKRRPLATVGVYLGAVVVLVVMAFPLYGIALTSIQLERDIRSRDVSFIPQYIDTRHYEAVLTPGHIVPVQEAMINSLIVSVSAAVIAVAIALPATYAMVRLRLPGRRWIMAGLISVYVFPTLLFIIPLYIQIIRFGLFDTYAGLVIPYVAFMLPFIIWILAAFLRSIPLEVEDAARVDGANQFQVLWKIAIPLMRPGIFAGLLMGFILGWIEFVTPLLFTSELTVLPGALVMYRANFDIHIGQLAAAAVITALPVVLVTAIFQRQITEVIMAGAER
jgi:ABC-type glycerol-3-phosphate transport system permease component